MGLGSLKSTPRAGDHVLGLLRAASHSTIELQFMNQPLALQTSQMCSISSNKCNLPSVQRPGSPVPDGMWMGPG